MLEEYMRGPFALDVIYRNLQEPTEEQTRAHKSLWRKLTDDYAGLRKPDYVNMANFLIHTSVSDQKADKEELGRYRELLSHGMHNQDESLLLASSATSRIHRN